MLQLILFVDSHAWLRLDDGHRPVWTHENKQIEKGGSALVPGAFDEGWWIFLVRPEG